MMDFGKENFGDEASPYISPYVYKRGFLDTTYGIRQVCNMFLIGNSPVEFDVDSNVHIQGQILREQSGFGSSDTK
jgi:hypothetical protein